ncbi:MAG: Ku protein [Rhodospirillales bacterium 69-11]|nr:Ku protein [Rhodospirillales bacterium]MBN8927039.1 Ku protein [Rhodospirillales bacterium]OJW27136.1 MAG: Ku protein [Rhodospirillales bacterium 69-11]
MATRPIWRGHLRLALVSCPVALHSVVRSSGTLRFHFINPKTGNRVRMVTMDAETDEELSRRDLVKGYEFEKDRYVLMEDEDFEAARIESSATLTVAKFVDRASIPPVYFDTSYYLAPDGDAGQDVFVVLRDAIERSGQAALSRVVIGRRERAVAILPMGKGMVCHTLHEPRDLYAADDVFGSVDDVTPDAEMVKLATQLIDRQEGKFEPADTEDRYETRLREVIDAKLRGEGISPDAPEEPDRSNVIDLMAALKASLGRGEAAEPGRRGRTPAKTAAPADAKGSAKAPAKAAAKKSSPAKAAPRKEAARKTAAKGSSAKAQPTRKRA